MGKKKKKGKRGLKIYSGTILRSLKGKLLTLHDGHQAWFGGKGSRGFVNWTQAVQSGNVKKLVAAVSPHEELGGQVIPRDFLGERTGRRKKAAIASFFGGMGRESASHLLGGNDKNLELNQKSCYKFYLNPEGVGAPCLGGNESLWNQCQ